MPALQEQHGAHDAPPPFRLDVQLHDLLKKSPAPRPILVPGRQAEKFPEPVFPQHPELMAQDDNYEENLERAGAGKRHWPAPLVYRAMNGWLFPYFKSRLLPGPFHPIIAYLFTEWKCNLDCHLPRAGLYGRGAIVEAPVGAQGFLLCRQERLLDLHADKRAAAPA